MSQSYATWPFACVVSLQETPNPALIRSAIEDGYPKVRKRFTKTWRNFQVNWTLMWEDYSAFWTFHHTECQGGATPFYITHPITKEVLLVRWKEPPQAQANTSTKPTFSISGTLEEMFS